MTISKDLRRKLLWAGGIIVGIVLVCVILMFTMFALSSVSIDRRSSFSYTTASDEEIVESGQFSFGGCVLFMDKSAAAQRIEEAYPYIAVVNIETVFPNSIIVHARERQETYALYSNGTTYFLDNELKVLRAESGEVASTSSNAIKITMDFSGTLTVGQTITSDTYADIYAALVENNRMLYEQISIIEAIEFGQEVDQNTEEEQIFALISTFSGQTYKICNLNFGLTYKMSKFLTVFSSLYQTLLGQEAYGVLWTKEKIDSAYIVINNYYLLDETNCYATVYENAP